MEILKNVLFFVLRLEVVKRVTSQFIANLPFMPAQNMYEVYDYKVTLDLQDRKGKKAVYSQQQKLHFLQDNVMAMQDIAWGEGNIFADYKVSPGKAVDRYREGHRHHILISFRETKSRGDVEQVNIERTILDDFTNDEEDWQTEVRNRIHQMTISIIFPKNRPPREVTLIEQNTQRSKPIGREKFIRLPNGRRKVYWKMKKPKLYEAYIIAWKW